MQEIDIVTEIRGFNRFYTNILGLLDQHILDSGYSLTEARVLFEISKTELCTANQLCASLGVDRSYMSRIIRKFEKDGLIDRQADRTDNRNRKIRLTKKGMDLFHELNDRSNIQVENLLLKLDEADKAHLINAVRVVKKYFTIASKDIHIRSFREEDIKYIIDRQLSLYESERQFTTAIWKDYLTQGVLALVEKFDAKKDCILVIESDGNAMGCIAVTHVGAQVAQLRYFFLEPELRGLGAGTKLLGEALDFCREKKYQQAFLWTVSAQESARQLYAKAGFQITETSENEDWGVRVLEEKWEMKLN